MPRFMTVKKWLQELPVIVEPIIPRRFVHFIKQKVPLHIKDLDISALPRLQSIYVFHVHGEDDAGLNLIIFRFTFLGPSMVRRKQFAYSYDPKKKSLPKRYENGDDLGIAT